MGHPPTLPYIPAAVLLFADAPVGLDLIAAGTIIALIAIIEND